MSIIPSQSYRKCGNTEVDIYLYSGLGPLQFNGSSCYPYAVLGFLTDVDINDPDINTYNNCIANGLNACNCFCCINCLPPPEPPIIPLGNNFKGVQNIQIANIAQNSNPNIFGAGGNSVIQQQFGIFEGFSVISIETFSIAELSSCDNINNNSNFSSTYNYPYNPSYPSCSDEISVVSDIQILGNNLVITKTTVRIPSIDIVHGVGILDTLESCDGLYPNSTNSNSISVSNNPCSGYNTSSVQLITDIFIEENKIKYKSATIKVLDVFVFK